MPGLLLCPSTAGAGSGPTGVVFHSDWGSGGLGTGDTAITDNGRWPTIGGNTEPGLEVIASTGLDFPSSRCLKVTARDMGGGPSGGFHLLQNRTLSVPAVGESRFYRWYQRVVLSDSETGYTDDETHPFQDGNDAGDTNWMLHVYHQGQAGSAANQWTPSIPTETNINGQFQGPHLDKGVTYRFEFRVNRTADTTLTMDVRIYDTSNNLLYTGANFLQEGGAHPAITAVTHAVNPNGGAASLGQINAGLNGLDEMTVDAILYMYQGCVCISSTTWCGPYSGGL